MSQDDLEKYLLKVIPRVRSSKFDPYSDEILKLLELKYSAVQIYKYITDTYGSIGSISSLERFCNKLKAKMNGTKQVVTKKNAVDTSAQIIGSDQVKVTESKSSIDEDKARELRAAKYVVKSF